MSSERCPTSCVTFSGSTSRALLIFVSASIAALIAHIGIDVLGVYLLPHDAYDDVAHGSRSIVSCTVVAAVAGAAIHVFAIALAARRMPNSGRRAPAPGMSRSKRVAFPVTLGVAAAMWRNAGWLTVAQNAALRTIRRARSGRGALHP